METNTLINSLSEWTDRLRDYESLLSRQTKPEQKFALEGQRLGAAWNLAREAAQLLELLRRYHADRSSVPSFYLLSNPKGEKK